MFVFGLLRAVVVVAAVVVGVAVAVAVVFGVMRHLNNIFASPICHLASQTFSQPGSQAAKAVGQPTTPSVSLSVSQSVIRTVAQSGKRAIHSFIMLRFSQASHSIHRHRLRGLSLLKLKSKQNKSDSPVIISRK